MHETHILLSLGGIGLLALLSQWLAWRLRLPAILFLLLSGIMAGPVLQLLEPQALFGPLLFPIIALAVALILFEGSLTLHLSEWRQIGGVVQRLVTLGALLTWAIISLASYYLLDFSWELALLFGTLTLVTGPTVIAPMLRVVRPTANVANILRWEGIVIDPIGALLAVVTFSFIASQGQGNALSESLTTFASVILCGCLLGAAGGWLFGIVLRHRWLPEYLHNFACLAAVLGIFIIANELVHESGLLAVTLMGMWLANMRGVDISPILHFKESLSVLLISGLFIILAARLDLHALLALGPVTLLLLAIIQFIARPLNIALCTLGSSLNWRERSLLAWIAPRGIVAAAVSAIFALRLEQSGHPQAELLVPLTFLVIIGTVVLQSATARPLARLLKVAAPSPSGVLIIGANPIARELGHAIQTLGNQVLLTDSDWENIRAARMSGLPTYFGNPTSQHAEDHLDLTGLGHLLAASPSNEFNALACMHFRHEFANDRRFTLLNNKDGRHQDKHHISNLVRGQPLGSRPLSALQFTQQLARGGEVHSTRLTETFDWAAYQALYGEHATLLAARKPNGWLYLASEAASFTPAEGWIVVALIDADFSAAAKPADAAQSTAQ